MVIMKGYTLSSTARHNWSDVRYFTFITSTTRIFFDPNVYVAWFLARSRIWARYTEPYYAVPQFINIVGMPESPCVAAATAAPFDAVTVLANLHATIHILDAVTL